MSISIIINPSTVLINSHWKRTVNSINARKPPFQWAHWKWWSWQLVRHFDVAFCLLYLNATCLISIAYFNLIFHLHNQSKTWVLTSSINPITVLSALCVSVWVCLHFSEGHCSRSQPPVCRIPIPYKQNSFALSLFLGVVKVCACFVSVVKHIFACLIYSLANLAQSSHLLLCHFAPRNRFIVFDFTSCRALYDNNQKEPSL